MRFTSRRCSIISTKSRKKIQIDGVLVIDKPEGIGSLDVVLEIKRRFSAKRAGHVGTLDPFATGVLPIVLNEGTKLVPFMIDEPKTYEAIMKLGEERTTDDPAGEVTVERPYGGITREMIEEAFGQFRGRIQQIPPMFSAVKVGGKPLYRLARMGIQVERKEREVNVFDLEVETVSLPLVHFRVVCSRGTYIRTLARDVGRRLQCGGHLIRLRRVQSGPFKIEQALPLEALTSFTDATSLLPWLISLREALGHLPEVTGNRQAVDKVRVGQGMVVRDLSPRELPDFHKGQWVKITSPEGGLIAVLKSEVMRRDIEKLAPDCLAFRPLRVFHASGSS